MTKHLIFRRIVMLCFCLCLFAAGELFSQTDRGMKITLRTPAGKAIPLYKDSYALVVGNGNYTNGWNLLQGALQDVDEVAEALEKHGFQVAREKDLTKREFEDAFEKFVEKGRDPYNRLLFYYAGHGHTEKLVNGDDLGYLVMVDAPLPTANSIDRRKSVDMESLMTQAKRIQSRHVLFVFDSCFSGTILNLRDRVIPEHISDRVKHPVRQFITAGRDDEKVPDRSVFKQEFVDLLEGRAPEPFPDGYITGSELGMHLETTVPNYNKGAQHPQHGKILDPKLNKGDFVFVLPGRGEPPLPPPLQTGSIFVTSEPASAQVTLAGVLQARPTPMKIQDVMAGTHMLKLTLQDYEDHMQQIIVEAGREVKVNSTLRRLALRPPVPRRGRSKWPFIIGGVVAASGAGVAAFVLSNRNEEGSGGGNGQISQPQIGDLKISISIP